MNTTHTLDRSLSPATLIRRALHRIRPQQAPRTYPLPGPPSRQTQQQLTAACVRTAFFPTVRRGYEPEAVRHLLAQVADEITRLQQRLAAVYAENDHIKKALKQWQSDHAATCRRTEPDTRTHWPVNRA